MPQIQEITTFKFSELSEDAKEKAISNNYDINVGYLEWWDNIYDDAENIGLKITGFDLDRSSHCDAEYTEDACYTANKIRKNHGETCETYQDAVNFLEERDGIVNSAETDKNGDFEDEYKLDNELDECEAEFLKTIREDYRVMLQKEYDYLTGEDAITESIESNEIE